MTHTGFIPAVVDEGIEVPKRKTEQSAGLDLCSAETFEMRPGERRRVRTGVRVAIPDGYVGLVFMRSGTAWNKGLSLVNGVGVIDSDYRGEIQLALQYNSSAYSDIKVEAGERIAQLVILPYVKATLFRVDCLDETERGEGGFGSTGV